MNPREHIKHYYRKSTRVMAALRMHALIAAMEPCWSLNVELVPV
jgi:hypothetical protein